jgi:hypothetical protein
MLFGKYIIRREVTYNESYVYTIYALAPVLVIHEILLITPYVGGVVSYVPFFTTILVITFLWYMFRIKNNQKSKVTRKIQVENATESIEVAALPDQQLEVKKPKRAPRKKKIAAEK